jgi:hypothetical protein
VRILRELAATGVPLGRTELAERCGLSLPGASAAIEKLLRTGMIEPVGGRGQQLLRLRPGHPLRGVVETLFRAESVRVAAVLDELRAVAMGAEGVRAAWVEGPVADGSDAPNEPVVLGFLAGSRGVSRLATALREAVAPLEREYDVTIADRIDASLGEDSLFHRAHGFYVHGLIIDAAQLPRGWERRTVAVRSAATGERTGRCIEAHDLAASKLAAFRDKDRAFVRTLLAERLVRANKLRLRVQQLEHSNVPQERIIRWLEITIADLATG